MTKKQKNMLLRIISSFILLAVLMICEHIGILPETIWIQLILFLICIMVLHYIILHLENSELYKFIDPDLANIALCKYIVYNLL